ncbi:MAG: HPP family protein [Anaerolineales bacterium]
MTDAAQLRPTLGRRLGQSLLAGGSIVVILLALDLLLHTAIASSLGATAFIVLAMPHTPAARPRSVLGGYLCGLAAGLLCWLLVLGVSTLWPAVPLRPVQIALGGAAVALATLLMASAQTPHPPAAGFALGLVLEFWDLYTLLLVAAAVLLLSGLRLALRRWLIDLA